MFSCFLLVLITILTSIEERLPYFLAIGHEASGSVKELFSGCTQSECESLSFHSDLQVSIYAKWMAVHNEKFRQNSEDRRVFVADFCGFVSGRLMMPLPEWWRDFLKEFSFDEVTSKYGFVETDGIRHSKKYQLDEVDPNKIAIKANQLSIELDGDSNGWIKKGQAAEFFPESQGADCIAVDINDNRVCVAVLPAIDCNDGFKVYCADISGAFLWSGYIAKFRQVELTSHHSPRGMVEICSNENLVAVFWRNDWEATIDVFDISTGNQVLDFSTLVDLEN